MNNNYSDEVIYKDSDSNFNNKRPLFDDLNSFSDRLNEIKNKSDINNDRSLYENVSSPNFANARRDLPSNLSPLSYNRDSLDHSSHRHGNLGNDGVAGYSNNPNASVNGKDAGSNGINAGSNGINAGLNGINAGSNNRDIGTNTGNIGANKTNYGTNFINRDSEKSYNKYYLNGIKPQQFPYPINKRDNLANTKINDELSKKLNRKYGLDIRKDIFALNSNGDKVVDKGKSLEEKEDEKRVAEGHAVFTKKQKKQIIYSSVITSSFGIILTCCVIFVAVQALRTILGNDLANVVISDPSVSEKLFGKEDSLGNDIIENNIIDSDS